MKIYFIMKNNNNVVLNPLCPFVISFESFVVKLVLTINQSQLSFSTIGLIVALFFINLPINCQEIKTSERIIAIAEELAADESDPGAADLFSDWLFELADNPVIINSGDENEISRLFFLNDFQVKVLTDYVKKSGRIVSPFEIANIPGFDRESAEMMIPFISLKEKEITISDSTRLRQTLLTDLILKNTMSDTSMLGSPYKLQTKYKFASGSISGGINSEKDPGEKLFSGKPALPDFLSGYLTYKGAGVIKRIIIGDYSARFGQGTNINTGIRTGLSLTTQGYLAGRNEIRPYTSTDENNFFRGLAADLSVKNLDFSTFFSVNKIDATLSNTVDSLNQSVKSFYTSGLHNTEATILKKDVIRETDFGVNLSYNFSSLRAGIIMTETRFSLPVIPDLTDPVYKYSFTGYRNSLFTIYYNGLIKKFILYGEFSASGINKYAFVQGISFRPAGRLTINLLYRNYSPGYVSFHGNGPVGSSSKNNEYGILGNFTFEAARFLFISAGSDLRYYPWLRYRCSAPSSARRREIRIKYLPKQKISLEASYNFRFSMSDSLGENRIPVQNEIVSQSVKFSVRYSPSEYVTLSTRADYKVVKPSGSKGMLLLQDINFKFRKLPVSIWLRYAIYNTDGFDSGLYTWENDLLNSFSIPVLFGTGNRTYIMASWRIDGRAELRFKYGLTTTSVINRRMQELNEFKVQFRIMI